MRQYRPRQGIVPVNERLGEDAAGASEPFQQTLPVSQLILAKVFKVLQDIFYSVLIGSQCIAHYYRAGPPFLSETVLKHVEDLRLDRFPREEDQNLVQSEHDIDHLLQDSRQSCLSLLVQWLVAEERSDARRISPQDLRLLLQLTSKRVDHTGVFGLVAVRFNKSALATEDFSQAVQFLDSLGQKI
jgi:hypothetical protein